MARVSVAAGAFEPGRNCPLCPRLVEFRNASRASEPDWHNAPVASFRPSPADEPVRVLIVGLAPGLRGANRTGRPFTGDYAGDLLYPTLAKHGFTRGEYRAAADDGLELVGCQITNAVRCVPPQNKPIGAEAAACRKFLEAEIASLADLRAILALGTFAHNAMLTTLGVRRASFPFTHGAVHDLESQPTLIDSYHCSRYNVNTGRLTDVMFDKVVGRVRKLLGEPR